MEIGHLHLLVKDVDVACTFYEDLFEVTKLADVEDGYILRDSSGIDFLITKASDAHVQGSRMHFGFRLKSKGDVIALNEAAKSKGIPYNFGLQENEFLTIFSVSDPDGNEVEVYHSSL